MSETECDYILQEIEHYLHGELDRDRALSLERHLSSCSPCFNRVEFQRKLKGVVRSKCRSSAPEHLAWKVRASLKREATGHDHRGDQPRA